MKKLFLSMTALFLFVSYLQAQSRVVIQEFPISTGFLVSQVAISTTTATSIFSSNTDRTGWVIENLNATYGVYVSSWAITSTSQGFLIPKSQSLSDDIVPYIGAIYGLGEAGGSSISVAIIDKRK